MVHVIHAYDVGLSIDLGRAGQSITDLTERAEIKHKGHAPAYFQFDPPPLRVTQAISPLTCGARSTHAEVDLVFYDFGGVSVLYEIAFAGSFEELIALSCELVGSPVFRDDSRRRIGHLVGVIGPAITRPNIDVLSEDYLVFQIHSLPQGLSFEQFASRERHSVARLLRSEADPLSEQETLDALSASSPSDARTSPGSIGTRRCSSTTNPRTCSACSSSPICNCSSCASSTSAWTARSTVPTK